LPFSSRCSEQPVDRDMRFEMRGKRIECALDLSLMTMPRRRTSEPFDPGTALCVVGEEAMHIGPGNAAVG
jgi:hypothetical protein